MLNVALCSSCSTLCSTPLRFSIPFVQHVVPLLLLDLLLCFFCLTCCFVPLAQFRSSYQTTTLLLLLDLFAQVPICYTHDFEVPCSFCLTLLFCSSCFKSVLPPRRPFIFCKCEVWRSCPNPSFSKLSSSSQTWKVKTFVFNFCLLMNFFNYPCFWEMVVNNVFFIFMQELFGHCTFNYTHCISLLHIAFHLHNCIVYFFSTLFFLSFNCL